MEAEERTLRGEIGDGMKTELVRKLFGAAPLQYVDWYIGEKRAQGLVDFAVNALGERVGPLIPRAIEGNQGNWLESKVAEIRNVLENEIITWMDEEKGPRDESGVPLSATGAGAKKRYEAFILVWIDGIVRDLTTELEQKITGPISFEAPGLSDLSIGGAPTEMGPSIGTLFGPVGKLAHEKWQLPKQEWISTWRWFEEGTSQAEGELRGMLPTTVMAMIDFDRIWSAVVNEIDLTQIRPSICGCTLKNAAVLKIVRTYGHQGENKLLPGDELGLYSLLLTCIGLEDVGKPWWEWQGR